MPTSAPPTAVSKVPVTCRVADEGDGELVKHLFTVCTEAPCDWLNWEYVSPHWIIGYVGEQPAGLILVGLGRPFGWIESLMVVPTLSKMQKGRLVHALEDAAYTVLLAYGAQGAVCAVEDGHTEFHDIVQRRGFVPIRHGTTYLKRLVS